MPRILARLQNTGSILSLILSIGDRRPTRPIRRCLAHGPQRSTSQTTRMTGDGGGSSSSSIRSTGSPSPRKAPAARPPRLLSPFPPSSLAPPPLNLTIRFSASLPDLHLAIPHPGTTTIVALKHLIRSRLAETNAQHRLRFIHGGRILPDHAVLSSVLRPPPPLSPPPTSPDPRGKGKQREGATVPPPHIYVNCSIGDVLTPSELAAEAAAAVSAVVPDSSHAQQQQQQMTGGGEGEHGVRQRRPRGFDRLLTAGFSAAEVNALRLQFQSIQTTRHTPDTMPSPDTLRGLEEAWLDNSNAGVPGAAGGGGEREGGSGAGTGTDGDEFGAGGLLDVMIRGMIIGFLWPVGSIGWLVREEGLWSRRWKVFVGFGFVLSLIIGMIRSLSSDR